MANQELEEFDLEWEEYRSPELSFLTATILVASLGMLCFYSYNYSRGKALPEEIYIALATAVVYGSTLLSGGAIIWVGTESGWVPMGRYFGWLLTCPVLLAQFMQLHSSVGLPNYAQQLSFLIIMEQLMIVLGAFAAISMGTQKWLFFVLGIAAGLTFLFQLYYVYNENRQNFPEDVKGPVKSLTFTFLFIWSIYPVIFVLGLGGTGYLNANQDEIASCTSDGFSKILLPYAVWYVRWVYLDNEDVTNTGRILTSRSVNSNGGNKFGLTEQEIVNAQVTSFHVLLVDKDILVHKAVLLMMEAVGVDVSVAFDPVHAMEQLRNNPSYLFDCLLVVPDHHKTALEHQALKDLSKYIVKDPYKIPMLAMYFNLADSMPEPGEYIHGIIQRPLDETSFLQDLYAWRITASMWRRIALTMENIENDVDLFPKLEDLPEETQATMMTSSMNVRRRGSLFGQTLMNNQGNAIGASGAAENHRSSKQELLQQPMYVPPGVYGGASPQHQQSPPNDAQRWQNVVSGYHQ